MVGAALQRQAPSLRHLAVMAQQPAFGHPACSAPPPTGQPAAQPTLWQQLLQGGCKRWRTTAAADAPDSAPEAAAPCRHAHTSAAPSPSSMQTGRRPTRKPHAAGSRQREDGRAGETDLGQGAAVVYQPAAFSPPDRKSLFAALQVSRHLLRDSSMSGLDNSGHRTFQTPPNAALV